jgi:hypothetical protein
MVCVFKNPLAGCRLEGWTCTTVHLPLRSQLAKVMNSRPNYRKQEKKTYSRLLIGANLESTAQTTGQRHSYHPPAAAATEEWPPAVVEIDMCHRLLHEHDERSPIAQCNILPDLPIRLKHEVEHCPPGIEKNNGDSGRMEESLDRGRPRTR